MFQLLPGGNKAEVDPVIIYFLLTISALGACARPSLGLCVSTHTERLCESAPGTRVRAGCVFVHVC